MSSPLLALFVRSLREDARGRATYGTRAALGGFLLLILFGYASSARWTNAPGRTFFATIISFQLVALVFVGLSYFTSAIAEEKEEQTLGLLRMTGLDSLSILLGKSTSRLCGALLLLVAQFPFTIFAITLGGISLRQIFAAYITVGAFTFFLCNLALLGSVLAKRTGAASAFCLLVMALLAGAGPLLWVLPAKLQTYLGGKAALDDVGNVLWRITPIARLQEVLGTGFSSAPAGWQAASNLALGVGCFLLAWAVFERFCDRAPDEAAGTGTAKQRFLGLRLSRPVRPWKEALAWKDFYFLCGGRAGFILRTIAYGGALIPFVYRSDGTMSPLAFGAQLLYSIVPFVFSIDVGAMAARMFRFELNGQTLATLATLPLTMRQIAYRKAFACLIAAAPGALATTAIQILMLVQFTKRQSGITTMIPVAPMLLMSTISSWVHAFLLVHVIAWVSLHLKRGALPVGYLLTYAGAAAVSIAFTAITMAFTFTVGSRSATLMSNGVSVMLLTPLVSMLLSLVAVWILHRKSLQRLELLAGES